MLGKNRRIQACFMTSMMLGKNRRIQACFMTSMMLGKNRRIQACFMTSMMMLGESILKPLTPSVNVPLEGMDHVSYDHS
jgi:hypothetical protein